ncbi:outer membrane beta-barrel protein [Desertivirga arenae]|uniref:outer membrane beta-barrel protein n=1 Tax=Desertivirga arenae TaxID=2810309 RepID=UPI001A95F684|nr:outer membrane beta-barrel protein [Pedobacter sp. SYSU D00823]
MLIYQVTPKLISTLLLLTVLQFPKSLSAQIGTGTHDLKGKIIDSLTTENLPFATVDLKESTGKLLKNTPVKPDGSFYIGSLANGRYQLRISYMGLLGKTINLDLNSQSPAVLDLGNIGLSRSSKDLKEVVVAAKKNIVTADMDKIIYNVQNDPESKGQNLLDIVPNIPLLSLDADDNVQLKGNTNFKVLINGKPSGLTARSPKDALRSIQASNVQKVEVITTPSAKYDSEGVGGIINIITKKAIEGINGLVGLFYNNLAADGAWVNLGIKKSKFGMFSYADHYLASFPALSFKNSKTSNFPQAFVQEHQGERSAKKGDVFLFGTEFSYELDSLNLFTGSIGYNPEDYHQSSVQDFRILDDSGLEQSSYRLNSSANSGYKGFDWGLNYQLGFKSNKDRLLTASYKYVKIITDEINDNRFTGLTKTGIYQQNEAGSAEQTFQLDYVHPLKLVNVEAGLKHISRDNFSLTDNKGDIDNNDFEYLQNVMSFYNSYQVKWNNWGFKAGARLERTTIKANFAAASDFKTDYTNLIPSLSVQRKFGNRSVTLGYTQRIERPGIGQLNPFLNKNNPLHFSYGNPYLKPALMHSFELGFNRGSLTTGVSYQFANNTIQNVVSVRADSISISNYENIGKYKVMGFNVNYKQSLAKNLSLSINSQIQHIGFESLTNSERFKHQGIQSFLGTNFSYKFEKDWRASITLNAASPFVKAQGEASGYFSNSLKINKDLFDKKLNLTFNLKNPFLEYRRVTNSVSTTNFVQLDQNFKYSRGLLLVMIYNFGQMKDKVKKNKREVVNDDVKKEKAAETN